MLGYVGARSGPSWVAWAMMGGCIALVLAGVIWMNGPFANDPLLAVLLTTGGIIPFAASCTGAVLIGLLVRRMLDRGTAR